MRILRKAVINGCMICLFITSGWNLGNLLKNEPLELIPYKITLTEKFKLPEESINENF